MVKIIREKFIMHSSQYIRNAIILGLITAVGPFAIDMYLPALPAIGADLGIEANVVVLSLTAFFISFGLFQMAFGTVADIYGRKVPLYIGITLFVLAGIGCALADNIHTLIALRFIQGIGGAACIIVPRAIVRDMYSGVEEVKMMSMLMLVFSVSPLLAPLAGSFIIDTGGWRAVFWTITAVGVAGLVLLAVFVKETWPAERRIKGDIKGLKTAIGSLLKDRSFVGMTLIGAFSITAFFIYLGNSAFVLSDHYGLSPRQYSLAFSVNAAAFFAATQLTGYLGKRFGMTRIVFPAAIGFATVMTLLAVLMLAGFDNLWLLCGMLFVGFSFVGIILPTIMVLALEAHGEVAGTAASFMNTVQLMIGSAAIAISGAVADGTPVPMVLEIAGAAVLTLFATWRTFKRA
jgi:DHA1 family bicyclomycin/chloramphenicol resistance-like MFS transporter